MHGLWEVPSPESSGQPNSEEAGLEPQLSDFSNPELQLENDTTGENVDAGTPYNQSVQSPLWELTIGGIVQDYHAPRPSSAHRQLRERAEQGSLQTLSDADLITLLLNTESKDNRIVNRIQALVAGHSLVELLQADIGELQKELGIEKAAQLKGLLEMARRLTASAPERLTIMSAQDAADLVMPDMAFLDHEEVRVLLLNTKNHVAANLLLYQGSLNSSVLRPSEIFRPAVTRKSASIIICHNHPSGIVTPSTEDIAITMQCAEAGKYLDIELLDHLIIGNQTFLSLKERMQW